MKTRFVILALVLYLLSLLSVSCSPCKKLSESIEVEKKDSVSSKIEIKYRDTVITVPADTAAIMALVKCPPSGVLNIPFYTKRSNKATVSVAIINNKLVASCVCDGLEKRLKLRDTTIEKYRYAMERYKQTVTVKEKFIPHWVKVLACIGAASILLAVVIIVLKIYKIF